MKFNFESRSPKATQEFAKDLGNKLRGGEVIELIGDVGAGKTTFVIGLAEGLGSSDHASSPTFTIHNTYAGRLTLHHCDFYRLDEDKLIQKELDDMIDESSVVVLEWTQNLANPLKDTIKIFITPHDGEKRHFTLEYPEKYQYII